MIGKLNEKQQNFAILGVGIFLALVFAVLCYLDYGEMEEINQKRDGEQNQITDLKNKRRQNNLSKKKLYKFQASLDMFKRMLPDKRKVFEFYRVMDKFRKDKNIQEWQKMVQVDPYRHENKNITNGKTRKKRKKKKSDFDENEYRMAFKGTYNQIGELLAKVENFDRLFSVKQINIAPPIKSEKEEDKETEPISTVTLNIITYNFNPKNANNKVSLDQQIAKYLKNFTPDSKLEEEIKEKRRQLTNRNKFVWRVVQRNPLDKSQVVIAAQIEKPVTEEDVTDPTEEDISEIEPVKSNDDIKKIFLSLLDDRNYLDLLATARNWGELKVAIAKLNYERKLQDIKILLNDEIDPEGEDRSKIVEMHRELTEWKQLIQADDRRKQVAQFIDAVKKNIGTMERDYIQGKKNGDQVLLRGVISKHNDLMPLFKDYTDMEDEFPTLTTLQESVRRLYDKADTQIRIMTLAQKLKLEGIIYWAENPRASVAFVNSKPVRRDDTLDSGFVVREIRSGKVILSYRGETVPIHLKKGGRSSQ